MRNTSPSMRGKMIAEGIVNLNKPRGMTSHDCVREIRRITGVKRVGHTGTLDPQTDGVLPVCIGNATRIVEYLDPDFKKYDCEMTLGLVTETQDIWGETVRDSRGEAAFVTPESIAEALGAFKGRIMQAPPKYSAVKRGGKRLYEYARAGEDVEIEKRAVYISELTITGMDSARNAVRFSVVCSKGTYIRTICHDAGEMLGCGAAMSGLTRLASGAFSIEDAVPLDDLKDMDEDEVNGLLKSADYPLVHFGRAIMADEEALWRFTNGIKLDPREVIIEEEPYYASEDPPFPIREEYRRAFRVYGAYGGAEAFLGVAFRDAGSGMLAADKVLFRSAGL